MHQIVQLPLSIIYYYLLSIYTANRTFTQSRFATIFRKIFVLYISFSKIDSIRHHY